MLLIVWAALALLQKLCVLDFCLIDRIVHNLFKIIFGNNGEMGQGNERFDLALVKPCPLKVFSKDNRF
jgi:hypothetical protein